MTIISGVTSAAVALGSSFLYYRQTKTSKELQNDAIRIAEWQKLYEESKEDSRIKDDKIDRLYIELRQERENTYKAQQECASLQVENVKLKLLKCEVPACQNRRPKTDY